MTLRLLASLRYILPGPVSRQSEHQRRAKNDNLQQTSKGIPAVSVTLATPPAHGLEQGRTGGHGAKVPIWLSAVIIILISALFIILGVALMLVWLYNSKEKGFSLITNNHYSWTYGPTAILVLVVAIWRQVDFHFKAAAPWSELQRGGATGHATFLLDYVSPLQFVSFWRALRNRHFSVVLTILGFVLLKLITLASTGLLVSELTELPSQDIELTRITKFNGSLYNITTPFASQDPSIAYTAYAILARGATAELGTTTSLVFETFDLPTNPQSITGHLQAEVNAFVPHFNCETAEVSINPSPYDEGGEQTGDTMSILSPPCQMMGGAQPVFMLDPRTELCPKTQFRGVIQRVNCSSSDSFDQLPNWQLLTMVEVAYEQVLNTSNSSAASPVEGGVVDVATWSVGIKQVKSLLCRPSYRMGKLNLGYNFTQDPPQITTTIPTINNATIDGFEDSDLALRFTGALTAAADMFGDLSNSQTAEDFPNTMFQMMAATTGGRYQGLMNDGVMAAAAESTFQQIAVQFAQKNLLENDTSSIGGTITSVENRLKINSFSLWIMFGGFAAMTVLSVCSLLMRPKQPLPPYQESIYGLASILVKNPSVQRLLEGLTGCKEAEVIRRLNGTHFISFWAKNPDGTLDYIIEELNDHDFKSYSSTDSSLRPVPEDSIPWWKPLTIRKPVVFAVLTLPFATVALLEVFQRLSDRHQGLVTLSEINSTNTTVYTRLIPASLMLIIATSINAIESNILLLAPFNALRSGPVTAERGIKCSLVDQLPPVAMWKAVKHRHYAAFLSSTAAIMGSVLTIVVSGLYTAETFSTSSPLLVHTNDTFNPSWPDSATNDGTASVIVSLTESLNLSSPAFTHDELALPLVAPAASLQDAFPGSTVQLTYPALRASLNCSILNKNAYNVSASYNANIESSSANVDARMPLPPHCLLGGPGANLSYIDVNYRVGFQPNSSYIGKLLDLHVGPFDSIQGSAFGETDPSAQNNNPPGCPSLGFIYGYVDVHKPQETFVTAVMCYQELQTVQTAMTFNLPSFAISLTQPPVPEESNVTLLQSGPNGETAFTYRIQEHMDQSLSLFNQTEFQSANLAESPVDNFFQGVLFGKTPVPISMMATGDNQATMIKGINSFYRRYMAQAVSNNMRVPVAISPPATESHSYPATMLNASQRIRLVQHNQAKITLQVLLSMMTGFTALAWSLTRLGDLVPYNPCTIFGAGVLLAQSNMCDAGAIGTLGGLDNPEAKYRLRWWGDGEYQSLNGWAVRRRKRYAIDIMEDH